MNFDLHSKFEIRYRNNELVFDRKDPKKYNEIEKIRRHNSLRYDRLEAGRISQTTPESSLLDISKFTQKKISAFPFADFLDNQLPPELCGPPKKISEEQGQKIVEMWNSLPRIKADKIISKDGTCYSSFFDYYTYDDKITEITSKNMVNYFWFMYGVLPVNNIYYEEIREGLEENSVIDDRENKINITEHRNEIFNINKGELPLESAKEKLLISYKQAIKFLGIVFGITPSIIQSMGNKERDMTKFKIYFISNSRRIIDFIEKPFEVLEMPYPKVTSSKYEKPVTVIENKEVVPQGTVEKAKLIAIITKISNSVDISVNEADFLFRKKLLTPEAMSLYGTLGDNFNTSTPEYKALMTDIKSNISILEKYLARPSKSITSFSSPVEVVELDSKLKAPAAEEKSSRNVISTIRNVVDWIVDMERPKVISRKMINFLFAWKVIDAIPEFGDMNYISSDNIKYLVINDESPDTVKEVFAKLVKTLNDKRVHREEFNEVRQALEVKNFDGRVNPQGRPEGSGQQGGNNNQKQGGNGQQNQGGNGQQNQADLAKRIREWKQKKNAFVKAAEDKARNKNNNITQDEVIALRRKVDEDYIKNNPKPK